MLKVCLVSAYENSEVISGQTLNMTCNTPHHYWKKEKIEKGREEAIQFQAALNKANHNLGQRLVDKFDQYKI
jgi:hypothetical protein